MIRIAKPRPAAFTLVEVMIVVSIIGLVASLLLPAIAKSRTNALTKVCIEQQRVIYGAVQRYELDYNRTLNTIRTDGVSIRNTLLTTGYVNAQNGFDCPSSPIKDYDDYQLLYRNTDLTNIYCTIIPNTHVLP